jgi:hypothetical protein
MGSGSWIRIGAIEAHLDAKTMNDIVRNVLKRKAESVTKDPDLRRDIGTEFIRVVTPYVPMKTGKLRESGRATTDGRLYWTAVDPITGENYAYKQYTTQYRRYTTPGTGPYWVEQVQPGTSDYDGDFISAITPIIIRRFDDGQK